LKHLSTRCREVLEAGGPLAAAIDGYAPRAGQLAMAERVAQAFEDRSVLVCEAGTGIGKTFAYLVPALLSGLRVIVSTGTKTLQDQLFHRDLPVVRDALKVPVTVALLKGRANYLCIERMQRAAADGGQSRPVQADLLRVRHWAAHTRSGDIGEVDSVPEDSPVWPLVTSTADNCLGSECAAYADCWVVKARREAQAAEVVVVNHHLFLADAALKDAGFGDVLPGADAVVFDEAHQLPQTAALFFGSSLSSRQLNELGRDAIAAQLGEAGDMPAIREAAHQVERAARELRLAMGQGETRAQWHSLSSPDDVAAGMRLLDAALTTLEGLLEAMAERGPLLANVLKRVLAIGQTLREFEREPDAAVVRWYETHARGFVLNLTPLDIAPLFQQRIGAQPGARVFTSATLAVRDDFTYFSRQLGLEHADSVSFESPFEYRRQALLYLPDIAPDPRAHGYTASVVDAALPVLQASQGRAFLLFTSHRALREAHQLLRERIAFPLLVQGELPRGELLQRFRDTPNAVLLGTASFWEGVDVRGDALSCVIIDKLPFSAPDDPMTQARIRALEQRGENPFRDFQLPEAVITLKQGVGRLIRDRSDRGVLCLCDPRLRTKPYGRVFLAALPPMRRSTNIDDVRAFFSSVDTLSSAVV
jgi:ATP-dependent DNA helicase DinG